MKKLILSAAILLGSLSTFAQANPETGNAAKTATTEETTKSQPTATDGYSEIKLEEVPTAVTEALVKSYPNAKLVNVYVNEKKQYKLHVKIGDKVGSLYAEADGKWIS